MEDETPTPSAIEVEAALNQISKTKEELNALPRSIRFWLEANLERQRNGVEAKQELLRTAMLLFEIAMGQVEDADAEASDARS